MSPIDTPSRASSSPLPPAAPPYVNEEPNLAMVDQGLDEAEDETREAVAAAYEQQALLSDDPQESLNDIDFIEGEQESGPPELAAMHLEPVPEDGD
jgi:hypothetical protein